MQFLFHIAVNIFVSGKYVKTQDGLGKRRVLSADVLTAMGKNKERDRDPRALQKSQSIDVLSTSLHSHLKYDQLSINYGKNAMNCIPMFPAKRH